MNTRCSDATIADAVVGIMRGCQASVFCELVVFLGKPHEFLYIFADCRAGRPQLVTKTDTPWIDAKLLYILPDKANDDAASFSYLLNKLTAQDGK